MELQEQMREAYNRMLAAQEYLLLYLNGPPHDCAEYQRFFAPLQAATDEYHSIVKRYFEAKYPETEKERRSA
jgi:hypothetical protein